MKKVELPENIKGSRTHRVTCLTTCEGKLWGGCQSGLVFSFCGEEEHRDKNREGGDQEEGQNRGEMELIFPHESQLLGEKGGVSAMVGEKGMVWVAGENGWLSLWKMGDGPIRGEELKYSAPLLEGSFFFKFGIFSGDDLYFTLEDGQVNWKGLDGEGSLLMTKVKEVKEVEGKQGGVGVVLVEEEGGRERTFELGKNGKKGVDCLKFGLFCMKRKRILDRVGEQNLERKLMSLTMVGERVWSFDDSFRVCIFFSLF